MKTIKQLQDENKILLQVLTDIHKHATEALVSDATIATLWSASTFTKEWAEHGFELTKDAKI